MKRWAILGILIAFAVGVLFLVQESTSERAGRRGSEEALGDGATRDGAKGAKTAGDANGGGGAAGGAAAAAIDDDPNRVPGPPITILGRVERDGRAVPGAAVEIQRARDRHRNSWLWWQPSESDGGPPPIAATTTDAAGKFSVTIPRRTQLVVRASAPGSADTRRSLLIPETGNPDEIVIELKAGFELRGRVVNEKNEGVAGTTVRLQNQGQWRLPPAVEVRTTDENGEFVYEDLAESNYNVEVRPERYPTLRQWAQVPAMSNLLFQLVAPGTIAGTVTDDAGRPLAGAHLTFTSITGTESVTGIGTAETDAEGRYRIENAHPGAISAASLRQPEYGRRSAPDDFPIPTELVREGKELRVDIQLDRGVTVRGKVVAGEAGTPVAGASVLILRMAANYRGMAEGDRAESGSDGRFEFLHVRDGSYALEASAPGGTRRTVRTIQGQNALTIDFFVEGGEAPPEQRIVLEPAGGVRGHAILPEGTDLTRVGLYMELATGNINGELDDFGNFRFEAVPVIEQTVIRCWNPTMKSEPFDVVAGEITEVTIDGREQGGFVGVVEDEQGQPVAGAFVQTMTNQWNPAQNMLGGNNWRAVRTDRNGRFFSTIQEWMRNNWAKQKWMILAVHRDYPLTSVKDLDMPAEGETTEVRLVLQRGGIVSGRVEAAEGTPVANAYVQAVPSKDKNDKLDLRQPRGVRTDFDGRFEIDGVAHGKYTLTVTHRAGAVEPMEVEAGSADLRLVIRGTESIAGIVLDEEGRPITQAKVFAIVSTAKGEERKAGVFQPSGRFHVDHLEPGSYAIEVEPARQGWQATDGFEKTRTPPVAAGSDNVVIEVTSGPSVSGRVISASGKAIAGAGVVAAPVKLTDEEKRNPWQRTRPSAITNGLGEFKIKGVGKEPIEVIACSVGYQPASQQVTGGAADVTLRLPKGLRFEGRVLLPDGRPLVNSWMNLTATTPETQQKLNDWQQRAGQSWNFVGGWQLLGTRTDREGKFAMTSLLAGQYRLRIQTPDGVAPDTIYTPGGGDVTIQLTRPFTIKGRVLASDGNPIVLEGNTQIYVRANKGSSWLRGTSAGADGTFELKGLPAGKITLQAWAGNKYKPGTAEVDAGELNAEIRLEPRTGAK